MAVTDVLTLDEFVDLYKILEMPEAATETELRERVNKLYLEAQRNLDHHNFRKRFYYQQLYEVHLPQAHQLLLNGAQRSEYDRFLACFLKGLPFPTGAAQPSAGPASSELGRSAQVPADMLPTASAPPANAPAKPAPAKTTFTFQPDALPPPATQPPAPARPSAPASRPARPATPPTPKAEPGEATTSLAAQVAKRKAQVLMDASEVERRRDYKRRELIKKELTAAGHTWGMGTGVGVFAFVALLAFFLSHLNGTIIAGGIALAAVLAVVAGRYALREARRRIVVDLSKMPYDELLRRCAK